MLNKNFSVVRTRLLVDYNRHKHPTLLLRRLSSAADAIIKQLAEQCELPSDMLLIAIGGYGRRELFPQSDVDLLLLISSPAEVIADSITRFIAQLWDHGLRVSASVRSFIHCIQDARTDLAAHTAMLESRLLKGNQIEFEAYRQAMLSHTTPQTFFSKKLRERELRHAQYRASTYVFQPDCKNSPGALRDIHLLFWIARAAGYASSWNDFQRQGLLTVKEKKQFQRAETALKRLRISLHQLTGRSGDQLFAVYQERLANHCGILETSRLSASEILLARYEVTAAKVLQLSALLLERMRARLDLQESWEGGVGAEKSS